MNAGKYCLARIAVGLVIAGSLAACSVGDDGEDRDFGVERIVSDDADYEKELDEKGIVCETELIVTGTYVEGQPRPADIGGCWPSGTWTVQPSVEREGCSPAIPIEAQFVYEVVRDEENSTDSVTYPADSTNTRVNLKVTAGGGGCEGSMEHFGITVPFLDSSLSNNIVLSLNPFLEDAGDGSTLIGKGTLRMHTDDTFVGEL